MRRCSREWRWAAAGAVLCACLGVPAAGPSVSARQDPAVRLDVPAVKQPYNLCLAASVSMVLKYWGVELSPKTIGGQIPVYKDGTTGQDVVKLVEKLGFSGYLVQPPFEDLLMHLEKKRPLIVVVPAGKDGRHAVVLAGFDRSRQQFWLNDPASGQSRAESFEAFRTHWVASGRWTLLIVPR